MDGITTSVFDVNSFCDAHKISRALFYQIVREGLGPKIMKVGRRTLISPESAAQWRKSMEQSSEQRQKAAA